MTRLQLHFHQLIVPSLLFTRRTMKSRLLKMRLWHCSMVTRGPRTTTSSSVPNPNPNETSSFVVPSSSLLSAHSVISLIYDDDMITLVHLYI
jgi:hypothetical protein